jgi:nucleoside 2-deoxyribosyltransferase
MNIFISHAMKDKSLLQNIVDIIAPYGVKIFVAEHYFELQSTVSDKIKKMLNDCDIGLVLLTENGFNSGFVREEIGYLVAMNKPIVLLLEKGLEEKYSGFKYGHDYILFDPANSSIAVDKIRQILLNHWQKLQVEESLRYKLELEEQERRNRNGFFAIGALVTFMILASNE